jgi:hypothetical protein
MYNISNTEKIVKLHDIPQSNVGAPCPQIMATEESIIVKYLIQNNINDDDEWVTIKFSFPYSHIFGPPNDEAFTGHPLYKYGLRPYSAVEVVDSGWIRALESMNSVHPCHDKSAFISNKRHYILSFHDSTFECVAKDYMIIKSAQQVDSAEPSTNAVPPFGPSGSAR